MASLDKRFVNAVFVSAALAVASATLPHPFRDHMLVVAFISTGIVFFGSAHGGGSPLVFGVLCGAVAVLLWTVVWYVALYKFAIPIHRLVRGRADRRRG